MPSGSHGVIEAWMPGRLTSNTYRCDHRCEEPHLGTLVQFHLPHDSRLIEPRSLSTEGWPVQFEQLTRSALSTRIIVRNVSESVMFKGISAMVIGVGFLVAAVISAQSTREFLRTSIVVPGLVVKLNAGGYHPEI